MAAERRPARTPPICEHCCSAIEITSFTEITTTTRWPGCQGRRVFLHTECLAPAVAAVRHRGLLDDVGDLGAEEVPAPRGGGPGRATRVLVIANRTADSDELRRHLLDRHRRSRIAVTMLAPAIWEIQDPHGGAESAWRRLRAAQRRLTEARIEVSCVLGDPDPMTAFAREWQHRHYDEIVVSTLPGYLSRWLRVDLPRRIGHAVDGVPITHVVASPEPARTR